MQVQGNTSCVSNGGNHLSVKTFSRDANAKRISDPTLQPWTRSRFPLASPYQRTWPATVYMKRTWNGALVSPFEALGLRTLASFLVAEFRSPPKVYTFSFIVGNIIPKSVKCIHSATKVWGLDPHCCAEEGCWLY